MMQNKIKKYEEVLKDIMENDGDDDNLLMGDTCNNHDNYTIIEERNIHGITNKKIYTDLGESMYVIDSGKNLNELSNVEFKSIESQDSLKNYEKTRKICKNTGVVWGFGSAVLNIGKIIISFI